MSESRPPFPPFTLETAIRKVRIAEDSWNTCNPEKVSLGYAPTVTGAIGASSRWDVPQSSPYCSGSGHASWTIDSSRNFGRSQGIASPYASRTNGTMTAATGSRSYSNENWHYNEDGHGVAVSDAAPARSLRASRREVLRGAAGVVTASGPGHVRFLRRR
jgi:hypothetical protein